MTAADIYESLAAYHAAPEWAIFPEVSNATGGRSTRRADAVAMNLWPSRGLEIRAIEIKVSRSDLKRELTDPAKADAIAKFAHTFWLATPAGLVNGSPLPLGWGLFEIDEDACKVKLAAVPRPQEEVQAPTRAFVAAMMRAAQADAVKMRQSWIPRSAMQAELDRAMERGVCQAPQVAQFQIRDMKEKLDGARHILAAIGIDIDTDKWQDRMSNQRGKEVARQIALGAAILGKYDQHIPGALQTAQRAVGQMKDAIAALRELVPESEKVQP